MKIRFRIIAPHSSPFEQLLEAGRSLIIGRGSQANCRLEDPRLSRNHCRLSVTYQGAEIEDLNSANGTYVHGVKVSRLRVAPGDSILLGGTRIEVLSEEASEDSAPAKTFEHRKQESQERVIPFAPLTREVKAEPAASGAAGPRNLVVNAAPQSAPIGDVLARLSPPENSALSQSKVRKLSEPLPEISAKPAAEAERARAPSSQAPKPKSTGSSGPRASGSGPSRASGKVSRGASKSQRWPVFLELQHAEGEPLGFCMFPGDSWIIGRAAEASISLPQSKLEERHLRLAYSQQGLEMLCLASRQLPKVNGQRSSAKLLVPGDTIEAGEQRLVIERLPDGQPQRRLSVDCPDCERFFETTVRRVLAAISDDHSRSDYCHHCQPPVLEAKAASAPTPTSSAVAASPRPQARASDDGEAAGERVLDRFDLEAFGVPGQKVQRGELLFVRFQLETPGVNQRESWKTGVQRYRQLKNPLKPKVLEAEVGDSVTTIDEIWAPGENLWRWILRMGPLTEKQALPLADQLLQALIYCEQQKFVSSLLPINVYFVHADLTNIRLHGLGLQRLIGLHDGYQEPDAPSFRRLGFLPPELLENKYAATEQSDLYSLGSLLYYALTAQVPYQRGTPLQSFHAIQRGEPLTDPRSINATVSEPFAVFLKRLLAKDMDQRFANASYARNALYSLKFPPRESRSLNYSLQYNQKSKEPVSESSQLASNAPASNSPQSSPPQSKPPSSSRPQSQAPKPRKAANPHAKKLRDAGLVGEFEVLEKFSDKISGIETYMISRESGRMSQLRILSWGNPPGILEFLKGRLETLERVKASYCTQILSTLATKRVGLIEEELSVTQNLVTRIRNAGPLTEAEAVMVADQALKHLCEVHSQKFYEGPLKPDNVAFLNSDVRQLKIVSLGYWEIYDRVKMLKKSSDWVDLAESYMTQHDAAFSMAPELLKGGAGNNAKSNLYQLGTTLYYMVTAQVPFKGKHPAQTYAKIAANEMEPIQSFSPAVSESFSSFVKRLLHKDPMRRFADAYTASQALQALKNRGRSDES